MAACTRGVREREAEWASQRTVKVSCSVKTAFGIVPWNNPLGACRQLKTPICPTCGCSLVRLGVSKDNAVSYSYGGEELLFCCKGCVELFTAEPKKYLEEIKDLIVCPTCLAEKPLRQAMAIKIAGEEVYFCRCPHCVEVFQKAPDFYVKRLEGTIANEGVLDHEGCCVRPD